MYDTRTSNRVVLLSGALRLSGSSTWIVSLQSALRQLNCSVISQMLSVEWHDPVIRAKAVPSFTFAAVSQAAADNARSLGLDVRHALYNPLGAAEVRAQSRAYKVEGEYLLYVGKLHRGKGLYELLEAYAGACLQLPLWLVGSAKEQRVRELGISDRVRFLGFQSNPYPYIVQAKMLLLPSHSEAMGYVCLEAAVLGTPFLVSDYPAAREFFPDEAIVALEPCSDFTTRLGRRLVEMVAGSASP